MCEKEGMELINLAGYDRVTTRCEQWHGAVN